MRTNELAPGVDPIQIARLNRKLAMIRRRAEKLKSALYVVDREGRLAALRQEYADVQAQLRNAQCQARLVL